MDSMLQLGVVGNPIAHSLSPQIHQMFAEQCTVEIEYHKYLQQPDSLAGFIRDFFSNQSSVGLNVTLPFKQQVMAFCQQVSGTALAAQAVNTLVKTPSGIVGDNTDGIGLLTDIRRLGWDLTGAHIMLLGAGGAARGIAASLLDRGNIEVSLLNRTSSKVADFQADFPQLNWSRDNCQPSIIINTCSQGGEQLLQQHHINVANTLVYDISYGPRAASFLLFCRQQRALQVADGLGMLVFQAAHAFKLWFGIMPNATKVLERLSEQIE